MARIVTNSSRRHEHLRKSQTNRRRSTSPATRGVRVLGEEAAVRVVCIGNISLAFGLWLWQLLALCLALWLVEVTLITQDRTRGASIAEHKKHA